MNGYDLKTKLNLDINPFILDQLLIHDSAINEFKNEKNLNEIKKRNEYYSIAGKDLIELIIFQKLYQKSDIVTPHDLSNYIHLLKNQVYDAIYKKYNINNFVYLGIGESKNNINYFEIVERITYFIYTNIGFINLYNNFSTIFDEIKFNDTYDYRSLLQEYSQPFGKVPVYNIIDEIGPDNNKEFVAEVKIYDKPFIGNGKSKKNAYIEAAKACCYFYKVPLINNKNIKLSPIKENKNWIVTNERKKQLYIIYKTLNLSDSKLPWYYLDASFTHKSIENEKTNFKYYDNNNFLSMLGSIILSFVISEYFCDRFINNDKIINLVSFRGSIASNENLERFIPKSWENILIGSKGLKINNSKISSLIIDSFKSIIGSLFLNAFRSNTKDSFSEVNKIVYDICNGSIKDIEPNYTSILQSIIETLELSLDVNKIDYLGTENDRVYYCELKLSDNKSRINQIYKIGEGRSIKTARNNASYEMLQHIENITNTNNFGFDFSNNYLFFNTKSLLKVRTALSNTLNSNKEQLNVNLKMHSDENSKTQKLILDDVSNNSFLDSQPFEKSIDEFNSKLQKDIEIKIKDENKFVNNSEKNNGIGNKSHIPHLPYVNEISKYGANNPSKIIRTVETTKRNATLVKRLKELYNFECQICGLRIPIANNNFICEVHHIQPLGLHNGADKSENMIVVCPNHHAMFDNGIISIDLQKKEVIFTNKINDSTNRLNIKHKIDFKYLEYYNKNIFIAEKINSLHNMPKNIENLNSDDCIYYGDTILIKDLKSGEEFELTLEKIYNKIFMTPLQEQILGLNLNDKFDFNSYNYEIMNILKQV